MTGESIIALTKIRGKFLGGEIDSHAGIQLIVMAAVGIEHKIGLVANFNVEPFFQQVVEKIIGLVRVMEKIAKIDSNLLHGQNIRQ